MEDDVPKEEKPLKKPGGEPLTKKQELNNHIVLMRKVVRRARLHLINKLAKELKKLKLYKGTDAKAKEKAGRKAERLLQEIKLIKHLKEDKVSIFALQNSKPLEEILQNAQSSVEDRAIARLGYHSFVQAEVTKYREGNPHWKLQIPVLLEKSKEKRKQIDKKLREREAAKLSGANEQKLGVKTVTKKLVEESGSDKNNDDDSEGLSTDVESSEEVEVTEKDTPPEKPAPKETLQPTLPTKPDTKPLKKTPPKPKPKPAKKQTQLPSGPPKINKSQGTVRVKVLNCLEDLEEDVVDDTEAPLKVQVISTSASVPTNKRPKSSFFVGGEDDEDPEEERKRKEQRLLPKKPRTQFSSGESEFKPIFRKGKLVNKGPSGPKKFGKPQTRPDKSGGRYFDSNLTPLGENKKLQKHPSKSLLNPQTTSSSAASASDKLHPSWEAKKRQQISLSNFKGKKTTFGDDE